MNLLQRLWHHLSGEAARQARIGEMARQLAPALKAQPLRTPQLMKPATNPDNGNRLLHGDGTWPFAVEVDGADLVMRHVSATAFGGANDKHDNGETASGVSTKANVEFRGCALPMHYVGKHAPTRKAQQGSPIPPLPWFIKVQVTAQGKTVEVKLIDRGPAKWAADQIDLTVAAAKVFNPRATANNFKLQIDEVRIIGGAQYIAKGLGK